MTTVLTPADESIKDFSKPPKKIQFKIDNDIFTGVPAIAGALLLTFGDQLERVKETSGSDQVDEISQMMHLVLHNDSADLFMERFGNKNNPITAEQAMEISTWLMEQHGMRPTKPSSDSSTGSGDQESGTSSTESVPAAELISLPSPPPDSST